MDRSLPNAIATEKIWRIDQTNNENMSVYISPIKVKYKTIRQKAVKIMSLNVFDPFEHHQSELYDYQTDWKR